MRFTFGQFRSGVRDPSYRVPLGRQQGGPNPTSVLRKAVWVYHRIGEEAEAWTALEDGLSGYFAQPGAPMRQAASARERFRRYISLDRLDGRPAFDYDIQTDLVFGDDVLAVNVDLALFDPAGYAGRVVLWDQLPCEREQARLMAAPSAQCLEQELGEGRVIGVEVWHVRNRLRHVFDFDDAIAALGSVAAVLARARPEETT